MVCLSQGYPKLLNKRYHYPKDDLNPRVYVIPNLTVPSWRIILFLFFIPGMLSTLPGYPNRSFNCTVSVGFSWTSSQAGSPISNGRESKSGLGRVFNFKLGLIGSYCIVSAYSVFQRWKLGPGFVLSVEVCPGCHIFLVQIRFRTSDPSLPISVERWRSKFFFELGWPIWKSFLAQRYDKVCW